MGVCDFSCVLCSNEGEQNLEYWYCIATEWVDESDEDPDDVPDPDYADAMCNFPAQKYQSDCAEKKDGDDGKYRAVLFLYSDNPLEKYDKPEKILKVDYSWDRWDFSYEREELGYGNDALSGEPKYASVWYCNKLSKWVVNVCRCCYNYFINNIMHEPQPGLLERVLIKHRLIPFSKPNKIFQPEADTYTQDNSFEEKLKPLFPLKCIEIRDYIRAYVSGWSMTGKKIKYTYQDLCNNPLVQILYDGGKDSAEFSATVAGSYKIKGDIQIATPLQIAISRLDVSQISSLINRGAIPTDDQILELIICLDKLTKNKKDIKKTPLYKLIWSEKIKEVVDVKVLENALDYDSLIDSIPDYMLNFNTAIKQLSEGDFKLFEVCLKKRREEFVKSKYYDFVCNKDLTVLEILFSRGFDPQTHFADCVNRNWVEAIKVCLNYGAVWDDPSISFMNRRKHPEVMKLHKSWLSQDKLRKKYAYKGPYILDQKGNVVSIM